jgi:hypothetical protein
MIRVNVSANQVRRRLQVGSVRAKTIAEDVTREYGQRLYVETLYRASHAPGPNVITGRYLSSIKLRFTKYRNSMMAEVYSDEPYSQRLEEGFSGVDSAGRYSFSEPHPHFRPALEKIAPEYEAAFGTVGRRL